MAEHKFLPFKFYGGLVNWRLVVLHVTAIVLGLRVHVEGYPYGTSRNCRKEVTEYPDDGIQNAM